MEEHVSRVLKMLEEGKISASDAEKLIAALRADGRAGGTRAGENKAEAPPPPDEGGSAKSFEFRWSQRRAFPFDLSGLGRQISEAVRKIDPERIFREARKGRRWQARFKGWFGDEEERPENTLGEPTARATEDLVFDLAADSTIQVENNWGSIVVLGGNTGVSIEIEKEAWAPTEEEASARLREMKVDAAVHTPSSGPARLEVRVTAPEDWRDGITNLRLRVPEAALVRLATVFGDIRVENTTGKAEIHAVSGAVTLENLRGEARAESISGDMRAVHVGGALHLTTKSGDLSAEDLSRGGTVVGVSGDVRVRNVEGGRLEAKSVSGDVTVENVGRQVPIDIAVESVSGDVKLTQARGNIALKAVSGDVIAEHLEAITLQSQTVSGDVRIALDADFVGTLTTNTVSGDVRINLPQTSNFRFTLTTQSGDLHCDHTAHDISHTETLWTGTVGTGAGTVTVQTLSGDVHLGRPE